jgi:hypothetical protein
MFDGSFYLTGIDDKYKRFYAYKGLSNIPESGASIKSAKTSQVDFPGVPFSSAVRLNAMKMQLLASSNNETAQSGENNSKKKQLDSSVLRSVQVNFHKKPIQERLNEVNNIHKL